MSKRTAKTLELVQLLLPLSLMACAARPTDESVGASKASLSSSAEFRVVPSEMEPANGGPVDVAFGAGEFLLLNLDNLGLASDSQRVGRILPTGANLDPDGLAIGGPVPWLDWQSDGERFLMLTGNKGFSGSGSHPPSFGDVTIRRVSAAGTLLDTTQIGSPGTQEISGSGLACGPGHCLVVWMTPSGIQSVFLRSGPTLVVSPPVTLFSGALYGQGLAVAFDGNQYLVAANYSDTWFTQRVDAAGAKIDPAPRLLSTVGAWGAQLGTNGNGFLLLSQESSGGGVRLVAQRLNADGNAHGNSVTLGDAPTSVNPAVASDGSDYFVLWTACTVYKGCDVHGTRMDAAGILPLAVRDYGRTVPPNAETPALAWGGGTYLAAWEEAPNGSIYARRLDATGTPIDRQPVLAKWRTAVELAPSVTWDGCSYLAAWYGAGIRGALLDASGQPRQPTSLLLNDTYSPNLEQDRALNVLASRSGFLVYGRNISQLVALRLDSSAAPLDGEPVFFPDSLNPTDYSAASNGDGWLFAWAELTGGSFGPTAFDLVGRHLDSTGPVGSKLTVSNSAGSQITPSLGSNGNEYFAVWHDLRSGEELWGKRLNGAGAPVSNEFRIGSTTRDSPLPVASDGSGYLVAWTDGSQQPLRSVVQKFSVTGTPESPVAVLGTGLTARHIVFDGRTFLVHYVPDGSAEQFVRRVSRAGTVLDTAGQRLDVPNVSGIASDGRGRTLITYDRTDGRAWGRFLVADDAANPLPASCEPLDAGAPDGAGGSAGSGGGHCSFRAQSASASWVVLVFVLFGFVGRRTARSHVRD
jgi:hypothetical protein